MYKPIYNEKSREVIDDVINYLNSTRLEKSFIDTDALCHLTGYILHLEEKLKELADSKDMLKVYNTVLGYKIKDIEKILEDI